MRIQGKELNIDVFGELEPYLEQFKDYRIRGDKLQSCSPFRYEKHPSFAVNLENGLWIDSGSPTEDNYKGNLVSLLAVLSGSNYHDMEQASMPEHEMKPKTNREWRTLWNTLFLKVLKNDMLGTSSTEWKM